MRLDVHTDGIEGWKRRALADARLLDRGKRLRPSRRITFESAEEMVRMMSDARRKVFEAVRKKPAMTVSQIARTLKRDPSAVSKDVTEMERVGILQSKEVVNPGHGVVKQISASAEKITLTATL
jgi:predicted transcriptional regulator